MVVYKFFLQVKNSSERYAYTLDLNPSQEDRPEQIFTQEIEKSMQNTLQQKSLCAIKKNQLDKIIQTWIEDIREGYRESSIILDLPLLNESNIDRLQDRGNQELSNLFEPNLLAIEPISGLLPSWDEIFNP